MDNIQNATGSGSARTVPISPELWARMDKEIEDIVNKRFAEAKSFFENDGAVGILKKLAFVTLMQRLTRLDPFVKELVIRCLQDQLDYTTAIKAEFPNVNFSELDPSVNLEAGNAEPTVPTVDA